MKRWNMVVIAMAVMVLFTSCLSTTTSTSSNPSNDYQVRGSQKDPNKLVEKQLLSVTVPVENPEYMELSKWSKVRATSEILDLIAAHKYFSNSEKVEFMSYLFDKLPINGKDGVAREVHVGKFFEDGTNQHSLDVMEIRANGDVVIDAAPRQFIDNRSNQKLPPVDVDNGYIAPKIFGKDVQAAQIAIYGDLLLVPESEPVAEENQISLEN